MASENQCCQNVDDVLGEFFVNATNNLQTTFQLLRDSSFEDEEKSLRRRIAKDKYDHVMEQMFGAFSKCDDVSKLSAITSAAESVLAASFSFVMDASIPSDDAVTDESEMFVNNRLNKEEENLSSLVRYINNLDYQLQFLINTLKAGSTECEQKECDTCADVEVDCEDEGISVATEFDRRLCTDTPYHDKKCCEETPCDDDKKCGATESTPWWADAPRTY